MSSVLFFSLIGFFIYGIAIVLALMAIYALFLSIRALKIYIQKNS
ncbi:MAG: hypothetical protein K0R34_1502 [Herbinix sp.]|jgi:hypothetical protein|nr:hypothetical protein [Herbinix sp.]